MKRSIELAGGILEAIQFVLFVCGATALVAAGPFVWIYRLFLAGRQEWALVVGSFWIISVVTVAQEVRRKAITALSFGIFLLWLVVLTFVFRDWIV